MTVNVLGWLRQIFQPPFGYPDATRISGNAMVRNGTGKLSQVPIAVELLVHFGTT